MNGFINLRSNYIERAKQSDKIHKKELKIQKE
jgi:hypothetical protein